MDSEPICQPSRTMRAAGYIYNVAPKDGTSIGVFGGWIAFEPMWGIAGVQFDATKFNWLGNANREVTTCGFWNRGRGTSLESLRATETLVGSYGATTSMTQDAIALNTLLGTKIKIIHGYKGTRDVVLAAERGEVHGNTAVLPNLTSAKADWWRDKKVRVLLQASEKRIALLPEVPTAVELAAGNKDAHEVLRFWSLKYAMSYPLFMAAGVPAERVKIIRGSFDALMKDDGFLADAKRLAFTIDPLGGEPMTKLVADIVGAPKSLTDRVHQLMLPPSARK